MESTKVESLGELSKNTYPHSNYWSIVKGIGILGVVIGHIDYCYPARGFIYLFQLVIFFFVAGFFYKRKYTLKDYTIKKIKSLWMPFVVYGIIFILLHNWLFDFKIDTTIDKRYDLYLGIDAIFKVLQFTITEPLLGPCWFLVVLFVALITYDISRRITEFISKKRSELFFFLVIVLLAAFGYFCIRTHEKLPLLSHIAFLILPIIYAGEKANRWQNKINITPLFFVLSLLLLLVAFIILEIKIDMVISIIPILPLFYLSSFIGIYFVLGLAKILLRNRIIATIFAKLGKDSLHIMVLHMFIYRLCIRVYVYFMHTYPISLISETAISLLYIAISLFAPVIIISTIRRIEAMQTNLLIKK